MTSLEYTRVAYLDFVNCSLSLFWSLYFCSRLTITHSPSLSLVHMWHSSIAFHLLSLLLWLRLCAAHWHSHAHTQRSTRRVVWSVGRAVGQAWQGLHASTWLHLCVCVCVCVCARTSLGVGHLMPTPRRHTHAVRNTDAFMDSFTHTHWHSLLFPPGTKESELR